MALNERQQAARDRAVAFLQHYIGLLMTRTAGGGNAPENADQQREIERVVDDIIEACTPDNDQKTDHERAVEELRKEPQAAYQREFQGRGHNIPPADAKTTAADVGKK